MCGGCRPTGLIGNNGGGELEVPCLRPLPRQGEGRFTEENSGRVALSPSPSPTGAPTLQSSRSPTPTPEHPPVAAPTTTSPARPTERTTPIRSPTASPAVLRES